MSFLIIDYCTIIIVDVKMSECLLQQSNTVCSAPRHISCSIFIFHLGTPRGSSNSLLIPRVEIPRVCPSIVVFHVETLPAETLKCRDKTMTVGVGYIHISAIGIGVVRLLSNWCKSVNPSGGVRHAIRRIYTGQ